MIGQAGNDPQVPRLVYIVAFAPDAQGFLKLTPAGVATLFAQDLPEAEQAVAAPDRRSDIVRCLHQGVV